MEEYYAKAKKTVKKKKRFYGNFFSWLIMSMFFFIMNMVTSPGFHWWIFPTLGWGVGVAFQYVSVFGVFKSKGWEKREIKREMKKLYAEEKYREDQTGLPLDEIPNREKLDLPDFEELRKEWDDQEYV